MEQSVVSFLLAAANGQGIWTALSVALLIYVIKDSKTREDKLMAHLERTNEQHEKIAKSMELLERRMETLEHKIEKD